MIVADRDALGVLLGPAEVLDALPEWLQRLVYYVTGNADFILAVTVRTVAEHEALTRRLFFENHSVKHLRLSSRGSASRPVSTSGSPEQHRLPVPSDPATKA